MKFKRILVMLIIMLDSVLMMHKLVYRMDVSEHCRRRVMPSILLAKNVFDASSMIIHFSRKELPYSCSISVRAESGSNIIMVISVQNKDRFLTSCVENNPELLVYEMGETFGGYWGPLSETIMNQKRLPLKYYTQKTTERSFKHLHRITNVYTQSSKTTSFDKNNQMEDDRSEEVEDEISVEVPLVNVSAKFIPNVRSEDQPTEDTIDDMFDLRYDVTPIPGEIYQTSVIPLVQFSIRRQTDWRREGEDDEPRYDLDVVQQYTPDKRLTLPRLRLTTVKYRQFYKKLTTQRYRQYFKKNRTPKGKLPIPRYSTSSYKTYVFPTLKTSKTPTNNSQHSWESIKELINYINRTSTLSNQTENKLSPDKEKIMQKISDAKHNFSAYLSPNLSIYEAPDTENFLISGRFNISKENKTLHHTEIFQKDPVNNTLALNNYSSSRSNSVDSNIISRYLNNSKLISASSSTDIAELNTTNDKRNTKNLIQTVIAASLNQTNTEEGNKGLVALSLNDTDRKIGLVERKKREIHSLEIEIARPHRWTKYNTPTSTTQPRTFGVVQMQEFGQLVELQNDDMYGRVALRYLRQYAGPVFYNICDFTSSPKAHHVRLFNSSRIVLAVTNFSYIGQMTLILTATRSLQSGEVRCPDNYVECQVTGARVCVDSMVACDKIPNCGAYDIYDEDRLMCGESSGLQHNVYVAAFTFLAVLLTVLYAIHYWLKRCVPKVAEAFFIYTNGTDNNFYLNTIMRSPNEADIGSSALFYHPGLFENDIEQEAEEQIKENFCKRFWTCFGLCRRKKIDKIQDKVDSFYETDLERKRIYSFTELELSKIGQIDQNLSPLTGIKDSLEISNVKEYKGNTAAGKSSKMIDDSLLTLDEPFPEDYSDELSMLNFFKAARRDSPAYGSFQARFNQKSQKDDTRSMGTTIMEAEIGTHDYDTHPPKPGPSGVNKLKPEIISDTSKKIRFDEVPTLIPPSAVSLEEEPDNKPAQRQSNFLNTVMGRQRFLGTIDEIDESSNNKEHRHFWNRGKGKGKK